MKLNLSDIHTLTDFFKYVGIHYRIFDMGCRLSKMSASEFEHFEQCKKVYPLPWLRHAWLGVLLFPRQSQGMTQEQTQQHSSVWFLKFSLDEQGFLTQASRDEFLAQLLEIVSAQVVTQITTQDVAADIQDKLQHSLLAFTPDQERMAAFNSQAKVLLKQPSSSYFEGVKAYFSNPWLSEDWQNLGVQGFADLAVRILDDDMLAKQVAGHISALPLPVLANLAVQCENHVLPTKLAEAFLQRGQGSDNEDEKLLCLRAISCSANQRHRKDWILQLLSLHETLPVELLAAIASKCQADLEDPNLLKVFAEACASDTNVFVALVGELMYQDHFRQAVIELLRSPERNDQLAQAFAGLLAATKH